MLNVKMDYSLIYACLCVHTVLVISIEAMPPANKYMPS